MAGWRILTKLSHGLTPANKFLRRLLAPAKRVCYIRIFVQFKLFVDTRFPSSDNSSSDCDVARHSLLRLMQFGRKLRLALVIVAIDAVGIFFRENGKVSRRLGALANTCVGESSVCLSTRSTSLSASTEAMNNNYHHCRHHDQKVSIIICSKLHVVIRRVYVVTNTDRR